MRFRDFKRLSVTLLLVTLLYFSTMTPVFSTTLQQKTHLLLTAHPTRIVRQHSTVLDARLQTNAEMPIIGVLIKFYIFLNNEWQYLDEARTDDKGHANITTFIDVPQDQYQLKAVFEGNSVYSAAVDLKQINVLEESIQVSLEPITTPWGDPVNLTARLRTPNPNGKGGKPIPNREVNISIYFPELGFYPIPIINESGVIHLLETEGIDFLTQLEHLFELPLEEANELLAKVYYLANFTLVTDGGGFVRVVYTPPPMPGSYDVKVSFEGGMEYGVGEKIFYNALTVTKRGASISNNISTPGYFSDPITLKVILEDHKNIPIASRTIGYYILQGGSWMKLGESDTTNNGTSIFKFDKIGGNPILPGAYSIKTVFEGDMLYQPTFQEGNLFIEREWVYFENVTTNGMFGTTLKIKGVLTDNDYLDELGLLYVPANETPVLVENQTLQVGKGTPLPDKPVSVEFSTDAAIFNLLATVQTNATGYFSVSLPANRNPGIYYIRLLFPGDTLYQARNVTSSYHILKRPTQLIISDAIVRQYENTQLVATLSDFLAEQPIVNKQVNFYVEGSPQIFTYVGTAITNAQGMATYLWQHVELPSGTYNILGEFAGSLYHDKINSTDRLTVTPPEIGMNTIYRPTAGGVTIVVYLYIPSTGAPVINETVSLLLTDKNGNLLYTTTLTTDASGSASYYYAQPAFMKIHVQITTSTITTLDIVIHSPASIIDYWIIVGQAHFQTDRDFDKVREAAVIAAGLTAFVITLGFALIGNFAMFGGIPFFGWAIALAKSFIEAGIAAAEFGIGVEGVVGGKTKTYQDIWNTVLGHLRTGHTEPNVYGGYTPGFNLFTSALVESYLNQALTKGTVGFIYVGNVYLDCLYLSDSGGSYSFNFTTYAQSHYNAVSKNLTLAIFLAGNSQYLANKLYSSYDVNFTIGESESAPLVQLNYFARLFFDKISSDMGGLSFKNAVDVAYNDATSKALWMFTWEEFFSGLLLWLASFALGWLALFIANYAVGLAQLIITGAVVAEVLLILLGYALTYNPVKYS